MNAQDRLAAIFERQKRAYAAAPFPNHAQRDNSLKALEKQLLRWQNRLAAAMDGDFGGRAPDESRMLDILPSVLELRHVRGKLKRWMRPRRRRPELLFATNKLSVMVQPKGVVGIVAPWNFPVYLSLGPLIVALAAGNRAMIKLSEATPATNAALSHMLGEIFDESEVAVFGAELDDPAAFTALPFDHLVFTGSPGVGRIVMRAAAENLTPVTLELGGKSPAVVGRGYPIADAARRIAHGKAANCGQICVAPDYALAPKESVAEFVAGAQQAFASFFGPSGAANRDYCSIIDQRQFARLTRLLDDARAKGATVTPCAPYDPAQDGRRMPLHLVTQCTPDMALMQEEIFGPILPVLAYEAFDEALAHIRAGERPLALYGFTRDAAERRALLENIHAGGVTFNDWGWHVVNHDAPFGGVGHSGMGTYHGEEGFRALSHAKTVLTRHRFFPTQLFQPPLGRFAQKAALRFFLGFGEKP
jgi:coniferyl-aldehyde dehydrogenase